MLDWFSSLLVSCLCVLLILPSATLAVDFTGEAMDLSGRDTITALHNSLGERIRLNGIDCPEKRQAFGRLAWQFTSNLVPWKDGDNAGSWP